VYLHLSIFANTSQRRTKVKFKSIFIDLFNDSSDPQGSEDVDWRRQINAHVDDMPDDYLKYPGNRSISVSAAGPNRTFLDLPRLAHRRGRAHRDCDGTGAFQGWCRAHEAVRHHGELRRRRLPQSKRQHESVSSSGRKNVEEEEEGPSFRFSAKCCKVPSHLPQLIYVHLSASCFVSEVCVLYMFCHLFRLLPFKKSSISYLTRFFVRLTTNVG